jgi:hypothetical protein
MSQHQAFWKKALKPKSS